MAQYDFSIIEQESTNVAERQFRVKANTKAINQGEVIILDGSHAGYVTTIASSAQDTTSSVTVGISADASTQTASADGTINVYTPANGTTLRVTCKALTPASLTLAQETLSNTIDCSSGGVQTYDQGTTTNGILRMETFDNTTTGTVIGNLHCNYN